jgi:predicted O-linked N-acetylglucosamine transferase (SPINDLY family)
MNETDQLIATAKIFFEDKKFAEAEDLCREILARDESCADAWRMLSRMAWTAGDLDAAKDFSELACDLMPENWQFLTEATEVLIGLGLIDEAEKKALQGMQVSGERPECLTAMAKVLLKKESYSAASDLCQKSIRGTKNFAEGYAIWSEALQKLGNPKEALSKIRKACELEPQSVEYHIRNAQLLEQNFRFLDALAIYAKASRINPAVGFVWGSQGKLLVGLKRYSEAIDSFEKAMSLPGVTGELHFQMGVALHMSNRFSEAMLHYDQALAMGFECAALHCNRGVIFKDLRAGAHAIRSFYMAVKLEPTNTAYLSNLGAAALEIGLHTEALECFEKAIEQNPSISTAWNNIGNLLKDRAKGKDALWRYEKAMQLKPDDLDAPNNYLLCHMYIPDMDPNHVFTEHKKWGIGMAKRFPAAFKFKQRGSRSKIRVGFLSADLCHHPVAHFVEPIFREYDREKFEFIGYGDQRKKDDFSIRFAGMVNEWSDTCSLSHEELAKKIHKDEVDILFEMSGHTAYNRLAVFALKPAPIQCSFLGYPGTTGLRTIDYRLTDAFADPSGETENLHTEKLVRLNGCAWCYEPDKDAPSVQPPPHVSKGYVTFGCFNNMAKLNDELFETWTEILKKIPESHLRLKARSLTDAPFRKELVERFARSGIAEDRLEFFGHTQGIADHLEHYHSVDIALDSFPYHGTTTTCEAMWMGCPVVSRAGNAHVSRVGVSLLSAVGLDDFICRNREDYIAKAVELAFDQDRIAALRAGMRQRLQTSLLMNAPLYTRNFEAALMSIAALK